MHLASRRPSPPPTDAAATDSPGRALGVIVLLVSAVLIGFAPIMVKLSDLGPQAIAFWRLTLALPALAVWLAVQRRQSGEPSGRPDRRALVLAGFFFAGDLAFWHAGIKITTAANATLLANLTPIIVAIAGWVLFRERITARFALAAVIALVGAVLLAAANVRIAPERLPGDILSALTAFWYASYLLSVHWARRGASAPLVMVWSSAIAAIITLIVALVLGEALLPATLAGWLPLLVLGLVVHAGGQGGIAFGLGRVPAALAALIILVQPVVAAIAGWIIFGEALVASQMLGALFVLAGVYVAQRVRRPQAATPETS